MHPELMRFHQAFETPAHILKAEERALLKPRHLARLRKCKRRIGVTASCFDLMHAGHDLMLEEAKRYCDILIVLLQTDPTNGRPHKNQPVQDLHARFTELRTNRFVDRILLYDTERDLYEFLQTHARANGGFIDVRIVGEDYQGKDFTGKDLPIHIEYNWRGHDYSTTRLRQETHDAEVARRARTSGSRPFSAVASPAT
jgi:glycerol-3-phosphate cytidylyltransferase